MNDDPTKPLIENRDKHEVARDEKGLWLPGQSANPAGRPKRPTLTERLHKELDETPNAWKGIVGIVLEKLIKDKDKDILKEFWHYTDGMPKQSHEVEQQGSLTVILKREP